VILLNPYGAVTKMRTWRTDLWTEHLIMTQGGLAGRQLMFVNVYAPVHRAVRIKFFEQLSQILRRGG
jgi:hypothetical protein